MTLDLRQTSFYQGLASGTGSQDFEYGGKVDAFINFDFGKMGLWEGGGFRSHIEYSYGALATNLGGALFATNTALYWPVGMPEEVVATSLYYTQKVGERSIILLGKFNPVDLLANDPFFGGWGIDRFMNLILTAPPSGLIPVVYMGAVADGNPNYVRSSVIAGIGGRALFFGRPQDNFGVGAFYYNLSDVLEDTLHPAIQFRDESDIEFFYNYAVAPWLYIGPDIQYIRPARGGFNNALVVGLRLQVRI